MTMNKLICGLAMALGLSFSCHAQGMKISQYPNTATLTGTNLFIIAVGTTNKNISYAQLSNLLAAAIGGGGGGLQVWNSNQFDIFPIGLAITNAVRTDGKFSVGATNGDFGDYYDYDTPGNAFFSLRNVNRGDPNLNSLEIVSELNNYNNKAVLEFYTQTNTAAMNLFMRRGGSDEWNAFFGISKQNDVEFFANDPNGTLWSFLPYQDGFSTFSYKFNVINPNAGANAITVQTNGDGLASLSVDGVWSGHGFSCPTNRNVTPPTLALGEFRLWPSNGFALWYLWNTNGTTTGHPLP